MNRCASTRANARKKATRGRDGRPATSISTSTSQSAPESLRVPPTGAKWLRILDAEHDNLRAALAWSATPGADLSRGLRLGSALWRFWRLRGYSGEGSKVLLALLAIAPESLDPAIRLEALTRAALLLTFATDFATARTLFESALDLDRAVGDPRARAHVAELPGHLSSLAGRVRGGRRHEEEAIEIWRALGDRRALGPALGNLAMTVRAVGDLNASSASARGELGDHA